MKLRSYQIDLSTKGAEKLHNFKIVYFAIEPRCGKTIISLETCRKYGAKKVLFVTKKKAISSIESDSLHYPDLDVTVINYESVLKKVGIYDIIICDEAHACFLGNTLIDGVKIKDIKLGSYLKSFNFEKGIYENKKVINVFKNPLNENLVKIKCNGKEIVCTESHEIFTKRGWVKAKEILPSDELQVL